MASETTKKAVKAAATAVKEDVTTAAKTTIDETTKAAKKTAAKAEKAVAKTAEKAEKAVAKAAEKTEKATKATAAKAKKAVAKTAETVAAKANKKPVIETRIQRGLEETSLDAVYDKVLAALEGKAVKKLQVYVKPEDGKAYYVADGSLSGSVDLF